jgi:xanthine dehydrogenase YagS FAD-binding subunit
VAARRSRYLKVRDRASFEFAVVSVAATLEVEDGVIRSARLAAGGVGTVPWRLLASEAALAGARAEPAAFAAAAACAADGAEPLSQNGFKLELLRRTVQRALELTSCTTKTTSP